MLLELQQREYYEKPSAKRRKARLKSKLRQKIATK
jgi:ribosomal protein S21